MSTRGKLIAILALFSLCAASSAFAGVLATHPAAFNNGLGPDAGAWRGSLPYSSVSGDLAGDIDFAVFTAAAFNANFGGLGYVPGDALVYAYQIFNEGESFVSTEIVGVANPANTIGSFNIGDVDPNNAQFIGPSAQWFFDPTIPTGDSSWGLAFSSSQLPILGASVTVNGGEDAAVVGVPTPGPDAIPEPATLLLLVVGGSAVLLGRPNRMG